MLITTKVDIDLQEPNYATRINVVQGDTNTRCVEVALKAGGNAWQIPADIAVAMRYRKPDMTGGYYDTMPDGTVAWNIHQQNVISILLAPQMLTVAGTVFAQLELMHGNNVLRTFTMYINVEADPAANVIKSEDYVNWVQWMEEEVTNWVNAALASGNEFVGPAGAPGKDGYTPVRGVDYWTEEDQREILSQVQHEMYVMIQSESGSYIMLRDSANQSLQGLKLYGRTAQAGVPAPDTPVELVSVGNCGSIGVTMTGKNLLNAPEKVVCNSTTGRVLAFQCRLPIGNYIWSVENFYPTNGGTQKGKIYYVDKNGKDHYINTKVANANSPCTIEFTADVEIDKFCMYINSADDEYTFVKPMLRLASKMGSTYEPYKCQILAVATPSGLPGIPVSAGGNHTDENGQLWVCDEVDFEHGVYVQRVKKTVFDGDGVWSRNTQNTTFVIEVDNLANCTNDEIRLFCDQYLGVTSN